MSAGHLPKMSNAAFAGLLRLLLTPLNETPHPSTELHAYLDYLSRATRDGTAKAIGGGSLPAERAAH